MAVFGLIWHSSCWWLKSCTTWDVWNPINNGIFTISTGAGFLPSTVSLHFSIEVVTCHLCKEVPQSSPKTRIRAAAISDPCTGTDVGGGSTGSSANPIWPRVKDRFLRVRWTWGGEIRLVVLTVDKRCSCVCICYICLQASIWYSSWYLYVIVHIHL